MVCAEDGIFAAKLREVEKQYEETVGCLRLCQKKNHEEIRQEIARLTEAYRQNEQLLQQSVYSSRSRAVAALADVQLRYNREAERILHNELPGYLHEEGSGSTADCAEAASLYGEYAIDFAAQAMRRALLAALSAMELQMTCEEQITEKEEEPQ